MLDNIRQGHYHFLWFGVCCATFSRARRLGGGPPPLRSNHHLWGFPDLNGKSLEKVQISNKLQLFIVKAYRLASRLGVPWAIENPLTSTQWQFQQIQSLRKQSKAAWVKVDYCQYGSPGRKRTGLFGTWPGFEGVQRACKGKVCSKSGCPRFKLEGRALRVSFKQEPSPIQLLYVAT